MSPSSLLSPRGQDLDQVQKELEVERSRSTHHALKQNELRLELASVENRTVVATAKSVEHSLPDFDLHQIRGWDWAQILVGAGGVAEPLPRQIVPLGEGDITSSSDLIGSDKRDPNALEEVLEPPPVESGVFAMDA
ncbi:hypothetical protein Q3G72_023238 [Acer saccharum]|nr:hypothetical protein Q3G72_023238 [Acer saccharum]